MDRRAELLTELAAGIVAVERPHPLRVAVDGCSAAGKTTLTDELAVAVRAITDREVVRVGLDWFKKALPLRTAYPVESPESYYLDTWDYAAIRDLLLVPLGPGGDRRYREAVMHPSGAQAVDGAARTAPADAVLLADGGFLQRPELDPYWDLRIFLDIGLDDVLRRGTARDQAWMDSAEAAAHRYRTRYIPGERRYLDEVRPAERAQIVIDNRDFAAPRLLRADWPG
ncbi:uridylate kinase [Catellatospora tritici]|uniref:uridylate kinase n=1 Tax=Catellatospora tritici TaxID=2851566 RepID=UPI001C2CCAA4|nr:uridylate kinase [Catellatospora tritici]MBV1850124.1 uridylate kinase [Catellatospora tritici]